jgi:hypothetical protein
LTRAGRRSRGRPGRSAGPEAGGPAAGTRSGRPSDQRRRPHSRRRPHPWVHADDARAEEVDRLGESRTGAKPSRATAGWPGRGRDRWARRGPATANTTPRIGVARRRCYPVDPRDRPGPWHWQTASPPGSQPYEQRYSPVDERGRTIGPLTLRGVRRVPREQWPTRRVREHMVPLGDQVLVPPDARMDGLLASSRTARPGRVLVLQGGAVVGSSPPRICPGGCAPRAGGGYHPGCAMAPLRTASRSQNQGGH